nr:DUF6537 domain-containing protein [Nocardia abscessus]
MVHELPLARQVVWNILIQPYEVARLSLDPAMHAAVAAEFGPGARVSYRLHPPILRALLTEGAIADRSDIVAIRYCGNLDEVRIAAHLRRFGLFGQPWRCRPCTG